MSFPLRLTIRGTGRGMPDRVFTNADFEKILDTSDEWITKRTGIRERRFTSEGETSLTMGLEAARHALAAANMTAEELDCIVFGTISPHYVLPATGCLLQTELGARHIPAFDLSAACCGYMYAMFVAAGFIQSGMYRNVLIVGSENLSAFIDFQDRASCILFGDGASAAVLSATDREDQGILAGGMGSDGTGAKLIWTPGGGSHDPASERTLAERLHYIRMKGREVYKFAVNKMYEVIEGTMAQTAYTVDDLALVIPHQSNLRIIESACERLKLPEEKVIVNIQRYGNTSSASVGICLDEARREGRVKPGDLILMVAFGAGLTWASALIKL